MPQRSVVIFDLGGVLIDWNPRHLYRKLFNGDAAGMEAFLTEVCHHDWNLQQDAGRSFAEAEEEAIRRHPDKERLIRAWRARFAEMIPGALDDTVAILAELKERGTPLYALSNWSAETFPSQRPRFPFLEWFDGIVLSGEERVIKPDPRIYRALLDRYGVAAADAVFIDDSKKNADAATALGIHGLHFTSAATLRGELVALGLL
jgi:2-haloacid dehalogenase